MIIIFGQLSDPHVAVICDLLAAANEAYFLFDAPSYPFSTSQVAVVLDDTCGDGAPLWSVTLYDKLAEVALDEVKSVWVRRFTKPDLRFDEDPLFRYQREEGLHLLSTLFDLCGDATWLPTRHAMREARRKPSQLIAARRVGLNTLPTYVGNHPQQALDFAKDYPYLAVKYLYKPGHVLSDTHQPEEPLFIGCGLEDDTSSRYVPLYTRKVSYQTLCQAIASLRSTPVIIQKFEDKLYELRVTIVGRSVFACKIDATQSPFGREDFKYYDPQATHYAPYELPEDLAQQCLALTDALGLNFGCIDLIRSREDDQYYFLEINVSGQWLWIEAETGLPISHALANFLINPPPR